MVEISNDISRAKNLLNAGEVIGLPTETVYGLAGNALNEKAILEIFKVKNRPKFDPLILHFSDFKKAQKFIETPSDRMISLIEAFSPGSVTYLVNKKEAISDLITAGLPRVAIRFPNHQVAQALLKDVEYPVAAPSANPFGYVSPTCSKHVADQLGHKIPFILEGGNCKIGLESTIIGEEDGKIIIYRKGGLEIEAIEAKVGKVIVKERSTSQPSAPGMLHSHYAPSLTTEKLNKEKLHALATDGKNAILLFERHKSDPTTENIHYLSEMGDLSQAASNLFSMLRALDTDNYDNLYVELVPEQGLGRAINDRLRRATNS